MFRKGGGRDKKGKTQSAGKEKSVILGVKKREPVASHVPMVEYKKSNPGSYGGQPAI